MIYGHLESALAAEIGRVLEARGMTLSAAESLTGGGLGACCVSVPGSSAWFKGTLAAYVPEIKSRVLGVPEEVLKTSGAVSEACVAAMAAGARRIFASDFALATSGVAGPQGDGSDNPVGTVWVALAGPGIAVARKFLFPGGREEVRRAALAAALELLANNI